MRNQICLHLLAYKRSLYHKTSCKFHSLKRPPHYKQSIYSIKLHYWLVLIWGARWHHRGTNVSINTASRARLLLTIGPAHSRLTADSWLRWIQVSHRIKSKVEITITAAILSTLDAVWRRRRFFYLSHTRLYREYITSSEMYSLHLTHPKWTHTRSRGQPCYSARGAVGGSVPCSRTPQSWYWRRRESAGYSLLHQQSLPDLRFEPTTFGLRVRLSNH